MILCKIGLHAWRTVATGSADEGYVTDQCQRFACGRFRTRYLKRRDRYKVY